MPFYASLEFAIYQGSIMAEYFSAHQRPCRFQGDRELIFPYYSIILELWIDYGIQLFYHLGYESRA